MLQIRYFHLILLSNVNLCNLWSLKINLTILLDIYQHPTALQMSSGDVLIDLTSRNVSQWLLKTREDFYKRRYGGFEFGIKSPLANIDNGQLGDILLRFDKATNLGESRLNFLTRQFVMGRIGKNAAARNFVTQSGFYLDNGLRNFEKENFDNIRVWFNNKGWAASVSYMNAVNNIVLRAGIAELRKT